MRNRRRTKEYLAALAYGPRDACLGADGGIVGHLDMPHHADLTAEYAVLADDGGSGYATLCSHYGVLAYHYIMGNLAEVVQAHAVADDGGFHFGTIDGGTGSYLYVIPYHHVSEMLYLLPASVGLGSVPESVGTYHAVGVEDDIVAYLHSGIDDYAGIDDAVMAYHSAGAYGHILVYDALVPDLASLADDCAGAYRDLAAYLGAAGYTAAPGTVAAVKLALVGDVLE